MTPRPERPAAETAELERLAMLLRTDVAEVAYLAGLDAEALRALRTSLGERIDGENRTAYRHLAAASTSMPARATAAVAMKRMPPRLAAAVVGDMAPQHAADLAAAMHPDYLRQVCRHLSPDAASAVAPRLAPDVLAAVLAELIAHRDSLTMAEVVGTLGDDQVRTCVAAFSDGGTLDVLVEVVVRISDPRAARRLLAAIPEQTLRAMLEQAAGTPAQWTALVRLLGSLPPNVRERLTAGLDPA